jgi:hypothetical protein
VNAQQRRLRAARKGASSFASCPSDPRGSTSRRALRSAALARTIGGHSRVPHPYVAFAQAVDAVYLGGFAERYEEAAGAPEGFVDVQSSEGTVTPEGFSGFSEFSESVTREEFSEFSESVTRASAEAEVQERTPEFAEPAEPDEIRHVKKGAEELTGREWLSKAVRGRSSTSNSECGAKLARTYRCAGISGPARVRLTSRGGVASRTPGRFPRLASS